LLINLFLKNNWVDEKGCVAKVEADIYSDTILVFWIKHWERFTISLCSGSANTTDDNSVV
jgi:hypothetical protein